MQRPQHRWFALSAFLLVLSPLSFVLGAEPQASADVPKGEVTKYSFDQSKV
jgi:hypothetical protein